MSPDANLMVSQTAFHSHSLGNETADAIPFEAQQDDAVRRVPIVDIHCSRRQVLASLLALGVAGIPVTTGLAQDASPVASPVALDASMAAGNWVARANDRRNGKVDGMPLQGQPVVRWSRDLKANLFLPPAPGDHIVVAHNEFSISAYDSAIGEPLWTVRRDSVSSAPSLVDGVVYSGSLDGAQALDARSGATIWHFEPAHDPALSVPGGFPPLTLVDAPIAVVDGVAYVSGGIYGGLWALDAATGTVNWMFDTLGGVPGVASIADGTVFVGTDTQFGGFGTWPEGTPSRLVAVDAAMGTQEWDVPFDPPFGSLTAPVVLDDTVLMGLSSGDPYVGSWNAYDRATGDLKWSVPGIPAWSGNASGANGRFFVPGGEGDNVRALDVETGATIWMYETPHQVWWGMLVVEDVLYINREDSRVEALDAATGSLLWSIAFPQPPTVPRTGLTYAGGVLYFGEGTTLYALGGDGGAAPEAGPSGVVTLPSVDPDASSFLQWSGTLDTPDAFSGPEGLAVRSSGEIFVVDSKQDRIQIFASDGTFERTWGSVGSDPGQFRFHEENGYFIGDVAFGASGNLYVSDPGNSRIQVFDPALAYLRSIALPADAPDDPGRPGGIAVDEASDRLYVTDFVHSVVLAYDLDGNLAGGVWGADGAGADMDPTAKQLTFLNEVTVGPDGTVFVVDGGRGRIRGFDKDGNPVGAWGTLGNAPGQFGAALAVAFDSTGNAYVTDYAMNRLQVFAPDGTVIGVIGAPGSGDGQFQQPTYLAVLPDGRVLVSDEVNDRVVVLTTALAGPIASPAASPAA